MSTLAWIGAIGGVLGGLGGIGGVIYAAKALRRADAREANDIARQVREAQAESDRVMRSANLMPVIDNPVIGDIRLKELRFMLRNTGAVPADGVSVVMRPVEVDQTFKADTIVNIEPSRGKHTFTFDVKNMQFEPDIHSRNWSCVGSVDTR